MKHINHLLIVVVVAALVLMAGSVFWLSEGDKITGEAFKFFKIKKLAQIPVCNNLKDCKSNELCKGKQIGTDKSEKPEYCVWSKADDKQIDKRKQLCSSVKMCVDTIGNCYKSGNLNSDNKYVCNYNDKDEPTGQNDWVKCSTSGNVYGTKFICNGEKWESQDYCLPQFSYVQNPTQSEGCMMAGKDGKKPEYMGSIVGNTIMDYYGCVAKPFPEEKKKNACPSGTKSKFFDATEYGCTSIKNKPFKFDGCVEGYEIGYDFSQSLVNSVGFNVAYYAVSCKLEGYIHPADQDFPGDQYTPCGNSGAMMSGGGGGNYCCVYTEQ